MSELSLDPNNIVENNEEKEVSTSKETHPVEELAENLEALETPITTDSIAKTIQESSELPADDIEAIEEIEEEAELLLDFEEDFSNYNKKDFVDLADKLLSSMSARNLSVSDVKNIDSALKVTRAAFDELQGVEKNEAKANYITENGSDDGFEYKNDNYAIRLESILIQIKEKRQSFFQRLEQEKEDYFEIKTRLLQKLRDIVDAEEKGETKNSWDSFKEIQTEWKNAGNINSPHNGSLWSAYNALVDRYFDIRSIQNELKDLDRKKNIEAKEAVVVKIEEISASLVDQPLSNVILTRANDLLQEYKHIGPGIREEQEILWSRLKKAFDVIYDKKRELQKENKELAEDTYNAKNQLLQNLEGYLSFSSSSINEWNAKTKDIQEIQNQWNAIKGRMSREKGKEISRNFWKAIKQFFKNKSDFFAQLEAKREANYEGKKALVDEAKAIIEAADFSAPATNKIIDLQKKWKTIGHVPEKYKNSLFEEFKSLCDSFFNSKRDENKSQDSEYKNNLMAKETICTEVEKLVTEGNTDLGRLSEFKKNFNAIGYVPRKEMKTIQDRFIKAINSYVKAASGVEKAEKDKLLLQNEAEVIIKGGGNLSKTENDLRRKIKALEDEISLTKNNLEFFGYSKGADKLRAEYQKKIDKAEQEVEELNHKLKIVQAAN